MGRMMAVSMAAAMSVLVIVLPLSCCCMRVLYQVRQRLSIHLAIEFNESLQDGESGEGLQDDEQHCCFLSVVVCMSPIIVTYRHTSSPLIRNSRIISKFLDLASL